MNYLFIIDGIIPSKTEKYFYWAFTLLHGLVITQKSRKWLSRTILSNNLETLITQFVGSKKYINYLHLFKEATLNENMLKKRRK